jgi:hypothetical protein
MVALQRHAIAAWMISFAGNRVTQPTLELLWIEMVSALALATVGPDPKPLSGAWS